MATIPESLAIAIQHHQGGRLQSARQVYRQILQADPNQPDATHLLGMIAHQQGEFAEAVVFYRRALQLKPDHAEVHNNLGAVFKEMQKPDEAIACWRRAVELKPDYVEAHYNLGNACMDLGDAAAAVACYRRAVELKPDFAEAHINLGNAWKDQKNLDGAIACYRRALELKPGFAEAHGNLGVAIKEQGDLDGAITCWRRAVELNPDHAPGYSNLGVACKEQGKIDEAVTCYRRALELKPDYAEVHNNLGVALKEQGQIDAAVVCYRRAVELKPDYAEAYSNLGVACTALGQFDDAVVCCRQALALKPDFAVAHNILGNALKEQEKLDDAADCYRRAMELEPDFADAHNNLGNIFKDQGNLDDAVACYRRALELKPDYVVAHSNLVFALQYRTGVTPLELAEAHAEFDRRHAASLYVRLSSRTVAPKHRFARECCAGRRRLGVAFVSADLGRHPVGYFLVRVLENIDQDRIETICYSDRVVKDDMTLRLQAASTQWHEGHGLTDPQLTQQIQADRIDILFDLAGHTAHNRLMVFARKPAPIQVTWAGYVGTTGLKAMDYLLADRFEIPPGAECHYRERVLRMPDGYVCYDPPSYAPEVTPLPALDRDNVTLGCFNNPAKITSQAIGIWAKILHRLPRSRLVLKFRGWSDRGIARRYAEMFAAQGIDLDRLEFLGYSPHAELLTAYNRIDLALDPFPYSGGLTTCEALWMGVPVITCPGETFASRHSLSHLSNIGLWETIARDVDHYVELAITLASDLPRLAILRAGLRGQMAVSSLCDGKRFAANFSSILRELVA